MYKFIRRKSYSVTVGDVVIGHGGPIVVQSMTTTPTEDTEESVAQIERIAACGGELVRLTAQGRSQAENLRVIKSRVVASAHNVPLVADIHFTSELAMIAARYVDKVRINPGNFIDKRANFANLELSPEEWEAEKLRLRSRFLELIDLCKHHSTALRIGVNHGSLSDRIMSRYGNTPNGMVVSAMEFLEICEEADFRNVVISMKSSNVGVMVESYRQMVKAMDERGVYFPLHLGVTEAGEGIQGRIRSAVGIGTLLAQGLGDTIRVSLTEEPENEIPAAKLLASYLDHGDSAWDPPLPLNGSKERLRRSMTPIVIADSDGDTASREARNYIHLTVDEVNNPVTIGSIPSSVPIVVGSPYLGSDWQQSIRYAISVLDSHAIDNTIIVHKIYDDNLTEKELAIVSAADFGGLFLDSIADGIWLENRQHTPLLGKISLEILQAARARISYAEIISCPGCGRTLYDLVHTTKLVKERFAHIRGLKLAVMGCIVNGPGEMADAEFGYVGSGPKLVTLYHHGAVVERNIPQHLALDKLEELINKTYKAK